jgi:hypothetical protein
MVCTPLIPVFFVAEHYGLRNTSSWGSKDLASAEAGFLFGIMSRNLCAALDGYGNHMKVPQYSIGVCTMVLLCSLKYVLIMTLLCNIQYTLDGFDMVLSCRIPLLYAIGRVFMNRLCFI